MRTVFETIAYDGRRVRLTEVQWMHIIFFHLEVAKVKNRIEETLKSPDIVAEGATNDTRICYKLYQSTPVASLKYLAVVTRLLNEEGFIITSYFTERVRRGKILWRKTE